MGLCFLKMGVCFFENESLFYRKWEFVFSCVTCSASVTCLFPAVACLDRLYLLHSQATLQLQCSSIERRFSIFRLKMVLLLFLALNIVIVESVLPGYVPTLRVNVGLRSRVLVENNQCQLFHLAHAGQCLWQLYSQSFLFLYTSSVILIVIQNNRSDFYLTKSGNDLIEDYFGLGYTYPEIVTFPFLSHRIVIRSVICY